MAETIRWDQQGNVALLRLSQPPLNALSLALRRDLATALDRAAADPGTDAIVLTGLAGLAGQGDPPARGLSLGLDPREALAGAEPPSVADLCRRIGESGKPVVALLHGITLGAGAELALAAHARLATGEAQIGFPDLHLGLCPGAGGTQRLPRFLGAQPALDLMLSQSPRPLRSRALRPLVDRLVPEGDDAEAAALDLARALVADLAQGGVLRRGAEITEGLSDPAANAQAIAAKRAQVTDSPNPAAARIVDCVEAATLLPFEAGLAFEATAFEDLLEADVSKALRHVAVAEARTIPALPRAAPRPVTQVALIGAGAAAASLAVACLDSGLPVVQFQRNDEAMAALEARIKAAQEAQVRAGRSTPEAASARLENWHGTTRLADLARADLLIEAVADSLPAKQQVFTALDRAARPGAVLVTTSTLHEIARIAAVTARPEAVLGLHLHSPAHLTRLAEVIPGPATSDDTLATVAAFLGDRLGRITLRSGTGGGIIGDLIVSALRDAGAAMLRQGLGPARIDSALQGYGFRHGIFQQMDMAGLETCLARGRALEGRPGFAARHLADLERLCLAGRGGQAAGRGYYLWQEGRAQPDRAVPAIMDLPQPPEGAAPLSPEAITLRAVAAMANAGARALRAGAALRPSDIDVAMIHGHGFPRWHGGPMKAADLVGLFEIVQALKRFAVEDPALYDPDPGFAALIREGETFEALNLPGGRLRPIPG